MPDASPGDTVLVQVRVWDASWFPWFGAAVEAWAAVGLSAPFAVTLGGWEPSNPVAPLLGLESFSIAWPSLVATTGPVSDVEEEGVTLNGVVFPHGLYPGVIPTVAWFEYGPTAAYNSRTPDIDLGAGTATNALTHALSGLHPGRTYNFRVVAGNVREIVRGEDLSFTTRPKVHQPGQPILPPPEANATVRPLVEPPEAAYWHPGTATLFASHHSDTYSIGWVPADGSLESTIVVQTAIHEWPQDLADIEEDRRGQALFWYTRLQAMLANERLVTAQGFAYARDSSSNPVYNLITDAHAAEMAELDAALVHLRAALRYVPYVAALRSYDQEQELVGETSGIRTLLRVLERFALAADWKGRILVTRTAARPRTSDEYRTAESFLQNSQREFELHHLLLSQQLSTEEQQANGLAAVSLLVDDIRAALIRLQNAFPPSNGEIIYSRYSIPSPAVDARTELLSAQHVIGEARTAWQQARADERQFDVDQTQLRDQLVQLRVQYLTTLVGLTGLDPSSDGRYVSNGEVFGSTAAVEAYLSDVLAPGWRGGEFGIQRALADRAAEAVRFSLDEVNRFHDRISIESRKSGEVAQIITATSARLTAIDVARGKASAISVSARFNWTCPDGGPTFTWTGFDFGGRLVMNCPRDEWIPAYKGPDGGKGSYNPGAEEIGRLNAEERSIQAEQQIRIEAIQTRAVIENLRLNQAQAQGQAALAGKDVVAADLSVGQLQSRIIRTINDYLASHGNLAQAYFNNPAYRLLRNESVNRADVELRLAQVVANRFARRLEYEWAERWPIGLDTGTPEWQAKASQWDIFLDGLETVFSTVNPHQVADFLGALMEWDRQLRNARPASTRSEPAYGQRISYRQHILGLQDYSTTVPPALLNLDVLRRNEELFRQYVEASLITSKIGDFDPQPVGGPGGPKSALLFRFPLELLNPGSPVGNYFSVADSYNHKIEAFDFNLVGASGFNPGGNPAASLRVMQRGLAALRTYRNTTDSGDYSAVLFNADPYAPGNKEFVWGNPNFAIYDSVSINSVNRPATFFPGTGTQVMANRPVAATEWVIFIDNGRQFPGPLDLLRLQDIEILVSYRRNSPPTIW